MKITYLKAFSDNYIWILQNSDEIVIVDPGQSEQVINYIITNKLNLGSVLLTHGHDDHVGGVNDLLSLNSNVSVYGRCNSANNKIVNESQSQFSLFKGQVMVNTIFTPGHTWDGVCFLITDWDGIMRLFCGDTLFGAGCGRVFTGDYQVMFESLNKLKNLPFNTLVYPAHEYTLKNLDFALFIESTNEDIVNRINIEKGKLFTSGNTLPTKLSVELKTNPFLRCMDPVMVRCVSNILDKEVKAGLDCFIKLRELRNDY